MIVSSKLVYIRSSALENLVDVNKGDVFGEKQIFEIPFLRNPFHESKSETGNRTVDVDDVGSGGEEDVVLVILHLFDDLQSEISDLVLLTFVLSRLSRNNLIPEFIKFVCRIIFFKILRYLFLNKRA
jgi:hypothetical protein